MRRWQCRRTTALLEGEPLVILTLVEDDEDTKSRLWLSQHYGRGITKSQSDALLDEVKYQEEKGYLLGIDLWSEYDYDIEYWPQEYYGPEWYEDERYQW